MVYRRGALKLRLFLADRRSDFASRTVAHRRQLEGFRRAVAAGPNLNCGRRHNRTDAWYGLDRRDGGSGFAVVAALGKERSVRIVDVQRSSSANHDSARQNQ